METETEDVQEQSLDITPEAEVTTDESAASSGEAGGAATETTTESAAPAAGLDAATLKTLIAEVFQTGQQAAAPVQAPTDPFDVSKLSPDELQRKFNMWNPSHEFVKKLRSENEDESLAAVGELVNGLVRQAVTMATFQQQSAFRPYEQQMERLQGFYAQQRESEAAANFAKAHPDLVPWEPLVQAVREQFVREIQAGTRKPFADDKAAFTALAEQTRQMVKKMPSSSGGKVSGQQSTRPSTVIAGGQGGTGGGSSARPTGKIEKLWS